MVGISPQVAPILGNPNFELDIELTRDKGNILTKDAAKAKATSAIASGITTAIDNFYDIRSKQAEIDQRRETLESTRLRNRASQRQEERDLAVQQAQLEIDQLNKSKEKANAVIAADLAKTSGEAYDLGSSEDPVNRLRLLTDPKYTQFRAENQKYVKDVADRMYVNGDPKTRSLLDNLFYKKNEQERKRKASVDTLKAIDKSHRAIRSEYLKAGDFGHIPEQSITQGQIVNTAQGPDLQLPDGTLLSATFGNQVPFSEKRKLVQKGIAFRNRFQDIANTREQLKASANGIPPEQVKTVDQKMQAERQRLDQQQQSIGQAVRNLPTAQQDAVADRIRSPQVSLRSAPVNQRFVNVAKQALNQGISEDQLRNKLKTRGLSEEEINRIIAAAKEG